MATSEIIRPFRILLFNGVSASGHHESWTGLIAIKLAERGFHIICLTPDRQNFLEILSKLGSKNTSNIQVVSYPVREYHRSSIIMKKGIMASVGKLIISNTRFFVNIWSSLVRIYIEDKGVVNITKDTRYLTRLRKSILGAMVAVVWYLSRPIEVMYSFFTSKVVLGEISAKRIESLLRKCNLQESLLFTDFFFIMDLDSWRPERALCKRESRFPVSWGGIRLNPFDEERVGKEGYFRDPKFRGLCMLNENLIQHYKNAWPTHIFTFLADFTNVCLPSEKPEIAKRMVDLAAGRRIVLLCGSIEGRKNIEAFCELASVCDKSRWFFALIGDLALQSFSQKDLSALENFKLLLPEKAFIHDAFILAPISTEHQISINCG